MTFTYTEIDAEGNMIELTEEELKVRLRNNFFKWFTEVSRLAGWSHEETGKRIKDPSWFFCFDDGMKPEYALEEARSKGVVQ